MNDTSHVLMLRVLVVLRDACPDHGRAPRGEPLWGAALLLVLTGAVLAAIRAGWWA